MLVITQNQLEAWLGMYFWPFARIAGCLMVAPVFGARAVPARIRIILALAISILVAPLLPPPPPVAMLSLPSLIITVQQILIGVAVWLLLQFIFDAVGLAGQVLANMMGLSFAQSVDPLHGASSVALGQFYVVMLTLTFLTLNGHLAMIEALVEGFQTLPIGTTGLASAGVWGFVASAAMLFSGALSIALPGVTALLVVNIGFGVISRAAPTLNLFAIGFPMTLIAGFVVLFVGMPGVQSGFAALLHAALGSIARLQGGQ
jgi:flagellar biosynthetic protein FliR